MRPDTRCQRCGTDKDPTQHHVLPKRHRTALLKQGVDRSELERKIFLCRPCHDGVEKVYKEYEGDKVLYFQTYVRLCTDYCRYVVCA